MQMNMGGGRGGFGGSIVSAIIAVPIGIILIIGSCILLYWNEGRIDYSKIASKSVAIQASQVSASQNGNFVSVTGSLSANGNIGDGSYLKPGPYIAVRRTVEEYAWIQSQHTNNNQTTYSYSEEWTQYPPDSSTFNIQSGHQNPPETMSGTTVKANSALIGAYSFDPQTVNLPPFQDVPLSQSNTILPQEPASTTSATTSNSTATTQTSEPVLANSNYVYLGKGNLSTPSVGDMRISYQALNQGVTATIFGQVSGGSITAYTNQAHHTIYDLLLGDRQTAIATLHNQYERSAWIIRGIGVGLIWLGLMMLFAPLDAILSFIPIAGEIGKSIIAVITIPVALILGGTVIIIGYSLHHIIDLLIAIPVVLIVCIGLFKLVKIAMKIEKKEAGNINPLPQQPVASNPSTQNIGGPLFPASSNIAPQVQSQAQQPQPTQPIPPQAPPPTQPNPTAEQISPNPNTAPDLPGSTVKPVQTSENGPDQVTRDS